jgi:drug/metabolite transporter (DMT)-like permease
MYTTFALVAFAFNSILCRLALRGEEADATGFTAVRLASGAAALVVISYLVQRVSSPHVSKGNSIILLAESLVAHAETEPTEPSVALTHVRAMDTGSWPSALLLFAYAVCFSFAYLGLTAGTGALILFGAVQLTMVAAAIFKGERPTVFEWTGLGVAVGGLVYLVFPGLASPPPVSSALMAAAGMSWGIYTLRGRSGSDPLANTTGNFVRSLPFVAVLAVIYLPNLHLSTRGIVLAVLSGAFASGVGYTIWYAAIKHHTSTRAAVLQLAVPVVAALLGIVLLAEAATTRLALSAALILGGIALTIFGKRR